MSNLFRFLSCTAIAVVSVFSTPCVDADIMGFQGIYAPANWTSSPGTGSINTMGAPGSIALTSGNDINFIGVPSDTDFSIVFSYAGTVNFSWRYASSNTDATYDPFMYFRKLTPVSPVVVFPVSNDAGPLTQSGMVSFSVLPGELFGFRQSTLDNIGGSATTTITLFSAPGPDVTAVPEPASASLLGIAVVTGAFWQFCKRRRQATTA